MHSTFNDLTIAESPTITFLPMAIDCQTVEKEQIEVWVSC